MNPQQPSLAVLRRLRPYVWAVRGRLLGSAAAALGAMLAGLAIPLLIQRIIDGPIANGDRRALVLLSIGVLALGVAEAGLVYLRRQLVARPTTDIEKRMRADLYHHLQRLPVAFHDRWPSGQLLSRAISDLSTIRRFVAFSGPYLVINVLTVLVGLVWVDLEVRPGETVALVGATGSGKTTLTALVPRLADVTGGRVLVDGVDVRDLALSDLRTIVATVFEDPVLFSASVRENVALGAPEATDDDVRRALRVAHAEGFVDALPWGLDTRIGEQGLTLSGGQRQRLALARAVLGSGDVGNPAVLVLDDPLSALDIHTEAEVEAALRRVLRSVTALVVAHRPSTVQLADRVALLIGGRIEAIGPHSELLAEVPEYRRLLSTFDDAAVAR